MAEGTVEQAKPRWTRTIESNETFAEDVSGIGTWVGPRTGPDKRDHGQQEDFVVLRLLVAWRLTTRIALPLTIAAAAKAQRPDFILTWPNGDRLGIEITQATEHAHQAYLTNKERDQSARGESDVQLVLQRLKAWSDPDQGPALREDPTKYSPFNPVPPRTDTTSASYARAIEKKVQLFDKGCYAGTPVCDLVVYDNTGGGFLSTTDVLAHLGRPDPLLGRFRQIHLVKGDIVHLDVFGTGAVSPVNVGKSYEIDFATWISDQVERLRANDFGALDIPNLIEEISALGRSDKRAIRSQLARLIQHLLKWQYQPSRRTASWQQSIFDAREAIEFILRDSPSLRSMFNEQVFAEAYAAGRKRAAKEIKSTEDRFPAACPFTPDQLMDMDFFPEATDNADRNA